LLGEQAVCTFSAGQKEKVTLNKLTAMHLLDDARASHSSYCIDNSHRSGRRLVFKNIFFTCYIYSIQVTPFTCILHCSW